MQPNGVLRGDIWAHSKLKISGKPGSDLVPFHKLTQWLTYSIIDTVDRYLGLKVTGVNALTALAEYRNGGLLLDTGAIVLKNDAWFSQEVNVGTELGDSYLDAGFVGFSDGSQLDLEKPASYRHGDVFCVVPIINTKVNQGVPKTGQYDFWAVGKNCCSTPPKVFRCGDYHDPATRSGLREITLEDREFYLHAVQQAMSTYDISSQYPMFFHWVKDPVEIANSYSIEGNREWRICLIGYICVNTLIIGIALVFFGRIGYLKRAYENASRSAEDDE